MLDNVAREIKLADRWLLYKLVPKQDSDKFDKIPMSYHTGRNCDVTDPSSWCSFLHAKNVCLMHPNAVAGAGFALGGGFVGNDFDRVVHDGVIDQQTQLIVDAYGSYTEYSPSGKGLHVIAGGELEQGRRLGAIEIYGQGRFFSMTGNVYQNRNTFAVNQTTIDDVVASIEHMRGSGGNRPHYDPNTPMVDETALIAKIFSDPRTGQMARTLAVEGDTSAYPSASEADLALIDMIGKHTQAVPQIVDLFMRSALGKRDKVRKRPAYVQRMALKSLDKQEPMVEIPKLVLPVVAAPELKSGEVIAESVADCFTRPGGLMGMIYDFVMAEAIKPMEEAAIAAALGLMAGICGRQYQCNRTGVNLYIMLLASTGSGKEAMAQSVSRLIGACVDPIRGRVTDKGPDVGMASATDFRGPAELTGKGVLNSFMRSGSMSFLCILPEFASKMASMSSPNANQGDRDLKRWVLDLFMKSSEGNVFAGSATADKDKDVKQLASPALSILCESTPERLYQALNNDLISDGLMPRFAIFERTKRSSYRDDDDDDGTRKNPIPTDLIIGVRWLMHHVLELKSINDTRYPVQYSAEAKKVQRQFRDYCEERLHSTDMEGTKQLWNRANLKVQRMAALYAISMNPSQPVIEPYMVDWARKLTEHEVNRLVMKFERGEIGAIARIDDRSLREETLRFCRQFQTMTEGQLHGTYHRFRKTKQAGYIPYSYLMQRACTAAFRTDPRGQKRALEETLRSLVDTGDLKRELPMINGQVADLGGTVYRLVHFD